MFKARLYSRRSLAIALCVIGMSLILTAVVLAAVPAGWSVTFEAATYDSGNDETTFTYRVCSDGSPSNALSHWVIGLCTDPDPNNSAYDAYVSGSAQGYGINPGAPYADRTGVTYCEVEAENPDPSCSLITGIKFGEAKSGGTGDPCVDGSEDLLGEDSTPGCDEFTFKLEGNWTGDALGKTDYAVKAPSCAYAGVDQLVTGPDCSAGPTAVTLSFFAAKSGAGGSVSPLWLGLIGLTVLTAGSLFWAKRRAVI